MTKAVLDSNIWDKLAVDNPAQLQIRAMCLSGDLEVIVPDTLERELAASPFRGVPGWFPVTLSSDSVFVLDHSRLGLAQLGNGNTFRAHRGSSKRTADAVLADVASVHADVFVTEDKRARRRFAIIAGPDKSLDYADFRRQILQI